MHIIVNCGIDQCASNVQFRKNFDQKRLNLTPKVSTPTFSCPIITEKSSTGTLRLPDKYKNFSIRTMFLQKVFIYLTQNNHTKESLLRSYFSIPNWSFTIWSSCAEMNENSLFKSSVCTEILLPLIRYTSSGASSSLVRAYKSMPETFRSASFT